MYGSVYCAYRSISTTCCLRVQENPAYEGQSPASLNNPGKLKLDCNPAYEGSTFNLDKQPEPTYETIQYRGQRLRLESRTHEYEIPDPVSNTKSGNTASQESGKAGSKERTESQTQDLERTYIVIQN